MSMDGLPSHGNLPIAGSLCPTFLSTIHRPPSKKIPCLYTDFVVGFDKISLSQAFLS